jgi:di/tricarboxylate transporter
VFIWLPQFFAAHVILLLMGIFGTSYIFRASQLDPTSALFALPASESRGNAGFLAGSSRVWC